MAKTRPLPELFDCEHFLCFLILSALALVLVPSAVTASFLLLNISGPWFASTGCLLIVLISMYRVYLRGSSLSERSAALALLVAAVMVAFLSTAFLYDAVAWDGISYHSEAILNLLHGVNPIHHTFDGNFPLVTNHYPKAMWYYAAAAGGTFHHFELGKSYNFFLIYACGLYGWRFFRGLGLERGASLLLAFSTGLNPIAASQILTFYVDGAMSSLLGMLVLSSISLLRRPKLLDRVVFVATAAACVTTKFTGAVYVCVVVSLVFFTLLIEKARANEHTVLPLKLLLPMILAIIGITLVIGFNPYLTNVLQGHNPIYPAAGANKVTLVSGTGGEGPDEFFLPHRTRFQNFAVSLFSASSEAQGVQSPKLKVPFTIHLAELRAASNPELRIAGWGMLMGGVFLGSFLLYLYTRGWMVARELTFGLILVLVTSFAIPYTWCARFTPQIALIPILLLAPCILVTRTWVRAVAKTLAALLLLNSALLLVLAVRSSFDGTRRANQSLSNLANACGPGEYWFDGQKIMVRYDMLPAYRGVTLRFLRDKPLNAQANISLPFSMVKGMVDIMHIDHCSNAVRAKEQAQ